jgi:hypothetical protein
MNLLESTAAVSDEIGDALAFATADRRKRPRIRVRWRIVLSRTPLGEGAAETVTENLSSDGFYCFSKIPFVAGELLFCQVDIPTADSGCGASHLQCRVRVLRVERSTGDDKYGIACLTEDYDVVGCGDHCGATRAVDAGHPHESPGENQSLYKIYFRSGP